MSHTGVQFDLWRYNDGSLHLNFEDVISGDDVDILVEPDGTLYHETYDDGGEPVTRLIPNIYDFLAELGAKGQGTDHAGES